MEEAQSEIEWLKDNTVLILNSMEQWTGKHAELHQFAYTHTLIFTVSGTAVWEFNQKRIELHQHSVFCCPYGATFCLLEASDDYEGHLYHFMIYQKNNSEVLYPEHDIALWPGILELQAADDLVSLSNGLWQKWERHSIIEKFRCQIDFQELIVNIFMMHSRSGSHSCMSMEEIRQYMEEHFREDMTIESLASQVKRSPKYFSALFKKKYDCTVVEYISKLRLQEARKLMQRGDLKIRDIAHRVGYKDEFYFSRKFKKETGLSPIHYMKNAKSGIIAYHSGILGQLLPLDLIPYASPLHPKWTAYYYQTYRREIALHLSAYRVNEEWQHNLELISREPAELIITSVCINSEERSVLEAKAPVLYVPETMNWREQFLHIAAYLGETWQAKAWLDTYDEQIHYMRDQLGNRQESRTAAVIRFVNDRLYVESDNRLFSLLYEELLFLHSKPAVMACNQNVTWEQLASLEADVLFVLVRQDPETRKNWLRLQKQVQWQQIRAVQMQNVIVINSDPWLEESAHAQLRKLQSLQTLYR